jgi:branched-chain amino acid transport system permease protein
MTEFWARFTDLFLDGLILGGVFALVAVGYSLVYGIIKLINFAHGEIAMFGAFFAYVFLGFMSSSGDLIFLGALIFSIVLTAFLGLLLERIAYRPLRKASRLSALITTIGMSLLLQNVAAVIWEPSDFYMFAPEIFNKLAFEIGHEDAGRQLMAVVVTWKHIIIMALVFLSMFFLWWVVEKTRLGKAMRACSQDADAAALMGVDINKVVAFTFFLGAIMASVSGFLMGVHIGVVRYDMGVLIGIVAFAAAVLGGIGSIPGAILGGVLIGMSQAMAAGYLQDLGVWLGHESITSAYKESVAFLLMILFLIFRPSGILGKEDVDRA